MDWTHIGTTVLASFMASLVEFVEALTVVLAVGTVRGWRPALTGTVSALLILLLLVVILGKSISQIPLPIVQLFIGTLLLMFGLRWLRKSILRFCGVIALHDEDATYAQETKLLRVQGKKDNRKLDKVGFLTAFKIVMLEGIEVVFIVIAIGTSGNLIMPASIGAISALLLVIFLGIVLHKPLGNIPENTLKFCVGILLSAFGTFWVGEGVHLKWPDADFAVIGLIIAYFLMAQILILVCRKYNKKSQPKQKTSALVPRSSIIVVFKELAALFVDDVLLAIGIVIWIVVALFATENLTIIMPIQCILFFTVFIALLAYSVLRASRKF